MNRRDFIKASAASAVAYTMGHSIFSSASDSNIGNDGQFLPHGGLTQMQFVVVTMPVYASPAGTALTASTFFASNENLAI